MCASSICSVSSLCASREDMRELADANAYSQKCLWLQVFCVRLASSLVLRFSSACVMTIDVFASADADLRFQMEEAGVSADVQKAIYAEGFTSVRVFVGLEESREGVRAALKSSFKLDGNESPALCTRRIWMLHAGSSGKCQSLRSGPLKRKMGPTG